MGFSDVTAATFLVSAGVLSLYVLTSRLRCGSRKPLLFFRTENFNRIRCSAAKHIRPKVWTACLCSCIFQFTKSICWYQAFLLLASTVKGFTTSIVNLPIAAEGLLLSIPSFQNCFQTASVNTTRARRHKSRGNLGKAAQILWMSAMFAGPSLLVHAVAAMNVFPLNSFLAIRKYV